MVSNLVETIIVILINSLAIILAFWVYFADRTKLENKLFSSFSILTLLWIDFGYLSLHLADKYCLLLTKLNLGFVPLFFVVFYFFTLVFSGVPIKKVIKNILIATTGVALFVFTSFTSFVTKGVNKESWGTVLEEGKFNDIYYFWVGVVLVIILIRLITQLKVSNQSQKQRITLFSIGFFIYAGVNIIVNILFPSILNNSKYYKLGDYSSIFLLGFTAYAILKHQLFNIKVIATETIVIMLSIVLLVEVFLSQSVGEGIIGGIIWVLATYGGYQLVKSVKREIQQADDLKKVTKELRNTNEELNNANEELKKLDKAKDEFISVASHELNTPLAAIEGYLSMILDEHMAKVDTKAKEYLGRAYQSSKRLAALIMDLLNVSRIEQGRIHMQYVETNICQLVEEVLNEIQIKADQKKIKLESTCSSKEIPKTWVDMARTHEVITNLVGNAIKFTEKGVIKVSASKVNNMVRIEVKDSGIGISKENLEKLFHKFSQVKRDEYEKQGTGLGLYISKSYVELMNGKIWAESEGEGKGTMFVVELPILKEKPFDPHEGEGAVIRSAPNEEVMKQVMAISEKHAIKK